MPTLIAAAVMVVAATAADTHNADQDRASVVATPAVVMTETTPIETTENRVVVAKF